MISRGPGGMSAAGDPFGKFDSHYGAGSRVGGVKDLAMRHVVDDVGRERQQ